jgi:hypothetical protein
LGRIPRSSDHQTVLLSKVQGFKVVFISHRWLRPWHTEQECKKNGHEWAGDPSPGSSPLLPLQQFSLAILTK